MKRSCSRLKPTLQCDVCVTIFKEKVTQVQGDVTLMGRWFHFNGKLFLVSSLIIGDEEGSCMLCGKIYRTARGLSVHLRTHIADKNFQCEICAKKCSTEG